MDTKRYLKTLFKEKEKLGGEEGTSAWGPVCYRARRSMSKRTGSLTPALCRPQSDFPVSTMPCPNSPQICLRTYTILVQNPSSKGRSCYTELRVMNELECVS